MGPLIGKPGKPVFSFVFQCRSTVRRRSSNPLRTRRTFFEVWEFRFASCVGRLMQADAQNQIIDATTKAIIHRTDGLRVLVEP